MFVVRSCFIVKSIAFWQWL